VGKEHLFSLAGFAGLLFLAWLSSLHKKRFPVRTVCIGVAVQLALGGLIMHSRMGREALLFLNAGVIRLLSFSEEGIRFLFGPLSVGPGEASSLGFILAVQYLPTIVFFMALMALLYHIRIMPLVVRLFSRMFVRFLKTSGAESLSVASNIFVGVESAAAVRPYLTSMTRSELMTMLTACMSTVAGSTMAVYVGALKTVFPEIAGHLISASVLSAPAAVVMAKIMVPEMEEPATLGRVPRMDGERYSNFLEAVIRGAMDGARQVLGIGALLIAFLGLVALLDGAVGGIAAVLWPGEGAFSVMTLLRWAFLPLAWMMGVPAHEAWHVAGLLGERVLLTEIPAYVHLADLVREGWITDRRTVVITSYALCGFTHVASVAIFVGGIGALAPERLRDLSRLGFPALWASILATAATGCVAGLFFTSGSGLVGTP